MKQTPSNLSPQSVLSAWQAQLQVAQDPNVKQHLLRREAELLPRFAEQYEKLNSLPRRLRRRLQRTWKQSLAGVALLLALGQAPALAATINLRAGCTLVQAINAANGNIVVGRCARGSGGGDTIVIPSNATQSVPQVNNTTPYGPTGLPVISTPITIAGNNSIIRRAPTATAEFRLFAVSGTGNLTLQRTTVSGGHAVNGSGGAIYINRGAVSLTNSSISTNTASGSDFREGSGSGGGVANINGDLVLTNSTISGNSASESGGGMWSRNTGVVSLTNSTISGNTAVGTGNYGNGGGGVYLSYSTLTLTDSTISRNTASSGGGGGIGIDGYHGSTVNLTNGTISSNSAFGSGGGIGVDAYYPSDFTITNTTISGNNARRGGAISDESSRCCGSTFTLTNSTVSGNTGRENAGGIYTGYVYLTVTNSTVTGNTTFGYGGGFLLSSESYLTLNHALVSGNTAFNGSEISAYSNQYGSGSVTANNFNLFGHSGLTSAQALVGFTAGGTDISATSDGTRPTALSAILNPTLASNNGSTQTHALVSGSPAVNTVMNGCPPPTTDQRGMVRPAESFCDIGSFELTATQPVVCNGQPATIVGTAGDDQPLAGTAAADVIHGLGGVDNIQSLGGNDVICGGGGNDTVLAGLDNDRAFGEIGNDVVRGGDGLDQVNGGEGADQLFGDQLNDALTGGAGTDRCDGGTGTDTAATCETRISIP